jgi:plastocyanin
VTRLDRAILLLGAGVLVSGEPVAPRRHLVEIRGMAFHPSVVEAARGDTIIWVNQDIVPHTATAKSIWDTGVLAQGKRGLIVGRQAGELRYKCTLHPTMTGMLVIR